MLEAMAAAVLDRPLHHAHILKCGPSSWRANVQADTLSTDPAAQC